MSLKQAAREVLELIEAGAYVAASGAAVSIAQTHAASLAGTTLYQPDQLHELLAREGPGGPPPAVRVTDATTQVAAQRACAQSDAGVAVLNFASARNPGGGFLGGARAQEEDLCRCSALYPTLVARPEYYAANRAQTSLLYTDHAIYSPRVPFFRTHGTGALLEEPFHPSVITAPAPNSGPLLRRDPAAGPAIRDAFRRRWGCVLALAESRGDRVLVLGAWGCGAFGGDPETSAETVATWLTGERFAGAFDLVEFAIPSQGRQSLRNLEAFRARLGS